MFYAQGYAELQTSSLLLSVASPFLKHLFDSVYETCDEPPKIVMPDFKPTHVAALLQYMQSGNYIQKFNERRVFQTALLTGYTYFITCRAVA